MEAQREEGEARVLGNVGAGMFFRTLTDCMNITIPWAVCACVPVKPPPPPHAIPAVCAFTPNMRQGPRPLTAPQLDVAVGAKIFIFFYLICSNFVLIYI